MKGVLAGSTEDDEDHAMATGFDRGLPTPDVNDNYVNALVMFSRGNRYARGEVIRRKNDVDGNVVSRTNYNAILGTREYCVEFYDGEVSKLTENVFS